MMRFGVVVFAMGLGVGCGKKDGAEGNSAPVNMETPRGTADGIVRAFNEKNPNLAVSLLPPVDLVKKTFDCPADELAKRLQQNKDGAAKAIGGGAGGTMDIAAFDKSGTTEKQLRVGDDFQGCKVKALVTVHESKIDFRMTKDGKVDFDGETWTFLKFGDEAKWYYFR